jgi:hypothetical protein
MIRDCFGASLVDSTVTPQNYSAWFGGTNLAATDYYIESLILSLSILSSTFLQSQDTVDNLQDRKSQNVRSFSSIPDYLVASYVHRFIEALITRCAASKATPALPIRSPIEFYCFSESSCFKYDAVDKRFSEVESVVDGY